MSSGTVRRVSPQDIQLVQNLIERCLQLYMNQKEVVEHLLEQAKIEPGFTELVWQKLEEENRDFFKAYYLRLMVKHQIMEFNKLLEQQVRLMGQLQPTGVTSLPNTNGSNPQSINQKPLSYAPMLNPYLNGSSTLNTNHSRRVDATTTPNMITNMQMMSGINGGGMIKAETAYTNPPSYVYGGERNVNVIDGHSTVGDSFSNETINQPLSDPLLDGGDSTFGLLSQIPRNFSLSDLTADYTQSSDIMDSYDRSPFLGTDAEHFLDSHDGGEYQGDNNRLDTISEGFSFDNLGSD